MKTVGIIAEYNPLHRGHVYQLSKARELTGADRVVIVMSGNFTQRGTPALLDKYVRAEMALAAGADLVVELPVRFATGSAERFAHGAVSLLDGLGVDALCFGSECGSTDSLLFAARLLCEEPDSFRETLRHALKKGASYPSARSQALSTCVRGEGNISLPTDFCESVWEGPNNILGIEYLKALIRLGSTMEVCTVKRDGAGYSDSAIPEKGFCSALAIREWLLSRKDPSALTPYLPSGVCSLLTDAAREDAFLCADDFSSMLFYRLLSLQAGGYTGYEDVSQALSDKIARNLFSFRSFSDFCSLLKSKDLTYARISRSLLHILLNIRESEKTARYARILGFRRSSSDMFSVLGKGSVPLLSKPADAEAVLGKKGLAQLKEDQFAAHLYESVRAAKKGGTPQNECRRQIIIV